QALTLCNTPGKILVVCVDAVTSVKKITVGVDAQALTLCNTPGKILTVGVDTSEHWEKWSTVVSRRIYTRAD
ncbi:hypothetical protein CHS0354_027186, partial [Potamilus streckersoni]